MPYQIYVVSWNHNNTKSEFRDKIILSKEDANFIINKISEQNKFIQEVIVLSTCNRVEFYFYANENKDLLKILISSYQLLKKLQKNDIIPNPLILKHKDAIEHLFAVSGGLKSLVIGENQILSQIKSVYQNILEEQNETIILKRLFQEAIRVGKEIRTKTNLCTGSVSISMIAVEMAKKIYASFENKNILIIGAGETAELTIKNFKKYGAKNIIVANRSRKRREDLASRFETKSTSLDSLEWVIPESDIIVTATSSKKYIISYEEYKKYIQKRNHKNQLIIDISSPRNIDPKINEVVEVFLYDIDDFNKIANQNIEKRKNEIPKADKFIQKISLEYIEWLKAQTVRPTISLLSQFFNKIKNQELEKFSNNTTEAEYKKLEKISESIIRKLLHYPIMHLKEMSSEDKLDFIEIQAIRNIFKLEKKNENKKN